MDILDIILNEKASTKDVESVVENFKSIFVEDNVAVQTANTKAKQIDELEKLKIKHEREIEQLKDRHERENDRLKGAKEKETQDVAIQKKREADRKANESLEEGKLVSDIQHIIDTIMKKINNQVGKEITRNQEKGLGMLNTLGSFVGAKVTDKKQEKGKLFLKFGEEVEEGRNYRKEYDNYHSSPEQIKRRAKRNEARRTLKNRKDIKGKDVHHKDNNPMNNDKSNLSIVSQKFNRTEPRLRTEKLSKDATIGDFIKDFQNSDAPQFKNQSAEEIKKMAVAAYYANQKRG